MNCVDNKVENGMISLITRKLFLSVMIFAFTSIAVEAAKKSQLTEVVSKYKKSNLVKIELTKTIKSKLLGKESKYKGIIYLSANKFRLNIEEPDKNQIIFDGKTIWNVQFPPKELPGPVQVAKAKLDKNTKKQILISSLISKEGLSKNFKVEKEVKKDEKVLVSLTPTQNELSVKDLEIVLVDKKISEINYIDDVGNKTSYFFEKTDFNAKGSTQIFKYTPPKGAQVTNL